MAALSAKLRSVENGHIAFWCPGCDHAHVIAVEGPKAWQWDRNVDAPTFSPSILIRVEWSKTPLEPGDNPAEWQDEVCHSFVRAGVIEFLGDCTHALRGQHVPLPDWPPGVDGMRRQAWQYRRL